MDLPRVPDDTRASVSFQRDCHKSLSVRGVPTLLMTASLPEHRKQAIEQVLTDGGEKLVEIRRAQGSGTTTEIPSFRRAQAGRTHRRGTPSRGEGASCLQHRRWLYAYRRVARKGWAEADHLPQPLQIPGPGQVGEAADAVEILVIVRQMLTALVEADKREGQ